METLILNKLIFDEVLRMAAVPVVANLPRYINNCSWSKFFHMSLHTSHWPVHVSGRRYWSDPTLTKEFESPIQTLWEKAASELFPLALELLCEDICSVERGSLHEAVSENNHFLWDAFIIMLCSSANQIKNEDEGASVWSLCWYLFKAVLLFPVKNSRHWNFCSGKARKCCTNAQN